MTLEELNVEWRKWMRAIVENDTREPVRIVVNKRRGITMLVDAAFGWFAVRGCLVVNCGGYAIYTPMMNGQIKVHRLIAQACGLEIDGLDVDHRNGNRLDNRLSNLRAATRSQNIANCSAHRDNTSGFKGVCWHSRNKRWQARIRYQYRLIHLGYHDTPELAAAAYDAAAIELHGEFARLNFPQVAA